MNPAFMTILLKNLGLNPDQINEQINQVSNNVKILTDAMLRIEAKQDYIISHFINQPNLLESENHGEEKGNESGIGGIERSDRKTFDA